MRCVCCLLFCQQLTSLWEDYMSKLMEQLYCPLTAYLNQFTELKVWRLFCASAENVNIAMLKEVHRFIPRWQCNFNQTYPSQVYVTDQLLCDDGSVLAYYYLAIYCVSFSTQRRLCSADWNLPYVTHHRRGMFGHCRSDYIEQSTRPCPESECHLRCFWPFVKDFLVGRVLAHCQWVYYTFFCWCATQNPLINVHTDILCSVTE